jgi:hypothetical protein
MTYYHELTAHVSPLPLQAAVWSALGRGPRAAAGARPAQPTSPHFPAMAAPAAATPMAPSWGPFAMRVP